MSIVLPGRHVTERATTEMKDGQLRCGQAVIVHLLFPSLHTAAYRGGLFAHDHSTRD